MAEWCYGLQVHSFIVQERWHHVSLMATQQLKWCLPFFVCLGSVTCRLSYASMQAPRATTDPVSWRSAALTALAGSA